MKPIPNRLECAYCKRYYTKGGECPGKKVINDEKGCMVFQPDERGCIRRTDSTIRIPLYYNFPLIGKWDNNWSLYGADSGIKIIQIYGLNWDTKTGEVIIHCDLEYFINEFSENYIEHKEKPTLKIIEGGAKQ